jgi:prepilin-type N-terminal cleavage/methylation domain-containing protein
MKAVFHSRVRAFTLIELLAVVTCVAILAALCMGTIRSTMASANKVREINAARGLVAAYQTAAADNNGRYLAGYDYTVNAANPVYKPDGQTVSLVSGRRYPFRLAPYLGDSFNGTVLVNKNVKQLQKQNPMGYDYMVSAYPALGLNAFCVGGVLRSNGAVDFGGDCVTGPGRARGSILAFASAGEGSPGPNKKDGYCYVSPPTLLSEDGPETKPWAAATSWKQDVDPTNYGHVDFRYDGKAVCAFLDGSVRMCSVEELNDMKLWTPSALDANDPNYQLVP